MMNWRCLKDDPPTGDKMFVTGRWTGDVFEWNTGSANLYRLSEHWTHWAEVEPCPKPKTLKQIPLEDIPKDGTQFVVTWVWDGKPYSSTYKYEGNDRLVHDTVHNCYVVEDYSGPIENPRYYKHVRVFTYA